MDTDLIQPPAVLLRSGSEPIVGTGRSLQDFWRWAFSDVLNNTTRGILAEYLVASALGIADRPRITWDPYDLVYDDVTIEVKSAAYIQSWAQRGLSTPCFSIRPTRAWDSKTNVLSGKIKRQAKVYVLCILANSDRTTINALDVDQWIFYVLPTSVLNETYGDQKTLSLGALQTTGVKPARYYELREGIDNLDLR